MRWPVGSVCENHHVVEGSILIFWSKTYADCLLHAVAGEPRVLRLGSLGSADDEFMRCWLLSGDVRIGSLVGLLTRRTDLRTGSFRGSYYTIKTTVAEEFLKLDRTNTRSHGGYLVAHDVGISSRITGRRGTYIVEQN
jgi:hypothetical protein